MSTEEAEVSAEAYRNFRKFLVHEAEKICRQLEDRWPGIITSVSLDTQEGEDAYIWIRAPANVEDEVTMEAAGLTAGLYESKGLYVLPRLERQSTA